MSPSDTITAPSVLITGCSKGGIGSALAQAFHDRGLHVFATARTLAKMSHLETLPNVTPLELDVVSPASITAAVAVVTAKTGGKLNYLVNNSGVGLVRPILDTSLEDAKKLFDVNLWGMVAVTQAFAPLIIAAKGSIVNISSLAAVLNRPWYAFYGASKAAVRAYGETLRLEMAPLGVKVVTVMSGVVRTNMFANLPEFQLPDDSSLYRNASKSIETEASGTEVMAMGMPAAEYAERVVHDILGGASGSIWRGKMASIAGFLGSYLPTWLLDRALTAGRGLDQLG